MNASWNAKQLADDILAYEYRLVKLLIVAYRAKHDELIPAFQTSEGLDPQTDEVLTRFIRSLGDRAGIDAVYDMSVPQLIESVRLAHKATEVLRKAASSKLKRDHATFPVPKMMMWGCALYGVAGLVNFTTGPESGDPMIAKYTELAMMAGYLVGLAGLGLWIFRAFFGTVRQGLGHFDDPVSAAARRNRRRY